jgi:hypothetical protein
MTDTHIPTPTVAHAAHDLTIVAALAARASDLDERTAALAREQVASCASCADLLTDLLTLQATLPTTATPARPRDFRLSDGDAARLHRSGWRRVLGFFGSPRDGFSRPLAIGFTTLGLAGLLVATVPSMLLSGGAAGAAPNEVLSTVGNAAQQAAPAPAASAAASAAPSAAEGFASDRMSTAAAAASEEAAGAGEPGDTGVFTGANPDEVTPDVAGDLGLLAIRDDASGLSVLFVVAGVLLIAGLGLFGLRWSARRLL